MLFAARLNLSRTFLASCFIVLTTADDSLWLVKLISSGNKYRYLHGLTFIGTLQFACWLSYVACLVFGQALVSTTGVEGYNLESIFQLIALLLTWFLALYFLVKKILKQRKKMAMMILVTERSETSSYETFETRHSQGTVMNSTEEGTVVVSEPALSNPEISGKPQVKSVFVLALLGSLDEIVIFPNFLLSNTFTIQELSIGCIIACTVILVAISCLLETVRPLLDCFDRIPFWVVISIFALIQTVNFMMSE